MFSFLNVIGIILTCFIYQYDRHNLLRVYGRDQYAYGRTLLEIMFTKQELAQRLLFKMKRSNKPALDEDKVDLLLSKCLTA